MKQSWIDSIFLLGRPFSPLYSMCMRIRQIAYEKGILKSIAVPRPVISVGNLSMGGTGKTPHVIAIARHLQAKGFRPAVISRGYGGKAGRGPVIVSSRNEILEDSALSGDEPCMIAQQLPGVPVIVGKNRFVCAKTAISRFGADLIVMDDGFQHLALQRDVDIVLLPAASSFGNGYVFPGGHLRESPAGLARASAVILSRCEQVPFNQIELAKNKIHELCTSVPVFLSRTSFTGIRMAGTTELARQVSAPAFCFCAIGDPDSFVTMLERHGVTVAGSLFFQDHHVFTRKDLMQILNKAALCNAEILLTTAKDFARMEGLWQQNFANRPDLPPVGIVEIEAEPEKSFFRFLDAVLPGAVRQ